MPRPVNDGKAPTGNVRAALESLRDQQEKSLAAINALLRSVEDSSLPASNEPLKPYTPETLVATELVPAGAHVLEDDSNGLKEGESKVMGSKTLMKEMEKSSKFGNLISGDDDAEEEDSRSPSAWCRWLLNKPQFDWVMGGVIFLNSIAIGIETEKSISDDLLPSWPTETLDLIFIIIYVIEITLRITAYGRKCFKDAWFLFDFFLVGMGIFGNILDPILRNAASEEGGDSALAKILVVRSLRLLRLVRAIRMLHMFRTVWRLVYGLLTSGNAILSTFFILLLTLYIFACLGVELIRKDQELLTDPQTAAIVQYHFGNLPRTLLSLVSFVASDSISAVYMPICIVRPDLIIYFVAIILTVSVSLMNLVTAVLVEGALANAANDKELSRHDMKQTVKKWAPKIMEVFSSIDEDGNGMLEKHELSKIQLSDLPFELSTEQVDNLEDLFDMLDVEGRGEISQVEFADGLLNLLTNDVPIHQMKTFKLLQLNAFTLERLESKFASIERAIHLSR